MFIVSVCCFPPTETFRSYFSTTDGTLKTVNLDSAAKTVVDCSDNDTSDDEDPALGVYDLSGVFILHAAISVGALAGYLAGIATYIGGHQITEFLSAAPTPPLM